MWAPINEPALAPLIYNNNNNNNNIRGEAEAEAEADGIVNIKCE